MMVVMYLRPHISINSISRWLAGSRLISVGHGGVIVGKVLAEGRSQFPGMTKCGSNTSESFGFHGIVEEDSGQQGKC